jgi:hypothetical protein
MPKIYPSLYFIIFHLFLLAPVPEPRALFFSAGPEPAFPLPADVFLALEFPVPFRSNFTSTPTAQGTDNRIH